VGFLLFLNTYKVCNVFKDDKLNMSLVLVMTH